MVNRYLPFVDTFMGLYCMFNTLQSQPRLAHFPKVQLSVTNLNVRVCFFSWTLMFRASFLTAMWKLLQWNNMWVILTIWHENVGPIPLSRVNRYRFDGIRMYAFMTFKTLPIFNQGICSNSSPSNMGSVATVNEDTLHSGRNVNSKSLACFSFCSHFLSSLFSAAHIRPRHSHYSLGNQIPKMYAALPNSPWNNSLTHCN